jgi:hypothetical protein
VLHHSWFIGLIAVALSFIGSEAALSFQAPVQDGQENEEKVVRKIRFAGNDNVRNRTLRTLIRTRTNREMLGISRFTPWYYVHQLTGRFGESPVYLDRETVRNDMERIRLYYENIGYFEATVESDPEKARDAANWITGEIFALMRDSGLELDDINISPGHIRELIDLVDQDTINNRTAKEVLVAVHESGKDPRTIVEERGLAQVSDEAQLLAVVRTVVNEHPDAVADYHSGKKAAIGFLIGQVMRQMRGTANPGVARKLLEETLHDTVRS